MEVLERGDREALYALASRSTIARAKRKAKPALNREVSERVYAVARVLGAAFDVWHGDADAAVRFLNRPHALLEGRTPFDVSKESTAGAELVVEMLGAGQAGVAV